MAVGRPGGNGIRVGTFVVAGRKVVEGLGGVERFAVEGKAIVDCTDKVLHDIEDRLTMLGMRGIEVQG
jgi:hypothetical protein